MEVDVTRIIRDYDMWDFAHSQSEGGPTAGEDTWKAALAAAAKVRLVTAANADTIRRYFADFGAWSDQDLEAMSNRELSALLIQFIADRYREQERFVQKALDKGYSNTEALEMLQQAKEEGTIGSNLFKMRSRWYYDLEG